MKINPDVWFFAQQSKVHEWADMVHLTADEALRQAQRLTEIFGLTRPRLLWEVDGLLSGGNEAEAIRNERTLERAIAFRGLGCTLLTLCHELVHCWKPWDAPYHEETDWDLATILLEECRGAVG